MSRHARPEGGAGFARPSLFKRLLAIELAAVGAVWIVLIAVLFYNAQRDSAAAFDRDLALLADALLVTTSTQLDAADAPAQMRALAEGLRRVNQKYAESPMQAGEFAWQLWRADGPAPRLIARSQDNPPLPELAPGSIAAGQGAVRGGWRVYGARSDDARLFVVVAQSSAFYARVTKEIRRRLYTVAIVQFAIIAAVLTPIVWLATRRGLRPLRALADDVAAQNVDELAAVEPQRPYAELEPLVAALNRRTERIARMVAAERNFFADAAHELRTLLAVISAQAHLLATAGEAERHAALRTLEESIERGAQAVSKLLALAKLDAAAEGPTREPIDLAELARSAVARIAPSALQQAQVLEFECDTGSLTVTADRDGLATLLDNLLDNALRYAGHGTTVRVGIARRDGAVELSVADNGPGIDAADAAHIFDRFRRGSGHEKPGSGLGLAIVQRVAELHRGSVALSVGPDGRGCTFRVRLPRG